MKLLICFMMLFGMNFTTMGAQNDGALSIATLCAGQHDDKAANAGISVDGTTGAGGTDESKKAPCVPGTPGC